jgi:coatomer subunit epsilon
LIILPSLVIEMESSELYHIKQQFIIGAYYISCLNPLTICFLYIKITLPRSISGAYKTLAELTLPDPSSVDYAPRLLYKVRSCIALNDLQTALSLLPAESEDVSVKAVTALGRYCAASAGGDAAAADVEAALEELRDLCVEIEGEDDAEIGEREKGLVRVLAGTAFVRAGEIEEALETLGAGTDHENLEA